MQSLTRGELPVQAGNTSSSAFLITLQSLPSQLWQEAGKTGHLEVLEKLGKAGLERHGQLSVHPST